MLVTRRGLKLANSKVRRGNNSRPSIGLLRGVGLGGVMVSAKLRHEVTRIQGGVQSKGLRNHQQRLMQV
jgi:hypothetical protein